MTGADWLWWWAYGSFMEYRVTVTIGYVWNPKIADCRKYAFAQMERAGAILTTSENVIFGLVKGRDHEKFKDVSEFDVSCFLLNPMIGIYKFLPKMWQVARIGLSINDSHYSARSLSLYSDRRDCMRNEDTISRQANPAMRIELRPDFQ